MKFKERIKTALASRSRVPMEVGPVPAAVLLPLFLKDGEFHLLFTKRTSHLTHHSGEISFPGGVGDPGDGDSTATALTALSDYWQLPEGAALPAWVDLKSGNHANFGDHPGLRAIAAVSQAAVAGSSAMPDLPRQGLFCPS